MRLPTISMGLNKSFRTWNNPPTSQSSASPSRTPATPCVWTGHCEGMDTSPPDSSITNPHYPIYRIPNGVVGLMLICDVGMGMGRIWEGVSIGMNVVWHFNIGILGVSGCRIWKIYSLVDAKGSVPEGCFDWIYKLTEWKCNSGIELGRGHSDNTSRKYMWPMNRR